MPILLKYISELVAIQGSDIAGSIRMPAFFNGIFGHKPTSGTNLKKDPLSRIYLVLIMLHDFPKESLAIRNTGPP